jgi:hypothetical protein
MAGVVLSNEANFKEFKRSVVVIVACRQKYNQARETQSGASRATETMRTRWESGSRYPASEVEALMSGPSSCVWGGRPCSAHLAFIMEWGDPDCNCGVNQSSRTLVFCPGIEQQEAINLGNGKARGNPRYLPGQCGAAKALAIRGMPSISARASGSVFISHLQNNE